MDRRVVNIIAIQVRFRTLLISVVLELGQNYWCYNNTQSNSPNMLISDLSFRQ